MKRRCKYQWILSLIPICWFFLPCMDKKLPTSSSSTRSRDTRAVQAFLSCGKLSVVFVFPLLWTETTSAASDRNLSRTSFKRCWFLTMFLFSVKHKLAFKVWTLQWTVEVETLGIKCSVNDYARKTPTRGSRVQTNPTWQHYLFSKASRTLFPKMLLHSEAVCLLNLYVLFVLSQVFHEWKILLNEIESRFLLNAKLGKHLLTHN